MRQALRAAPLQTHLCLSSARAQGIPLTGEGKNLFGAERLAVSVLWLRRDPTQWGSDRLKSG